MMSVKKILLVDDDKIFNYLTKLTLKEHGITCIIDEALDGQEALEYIANADELPDIILLDINMPRIDGFEFLKEYERQDRGREHCRIYMFTSSERAEDRANAMANRFVKGYFDKPLSVEAIESIIKS
jgi:CheY-like chemotaxis protein